MRSSSSRPTSYRVVCVKASAVSRETTESTTARATPHAATDGKKPTPFQNSLLQRDGSLPTEATCEAHRQKYLEEVREIELFVRMQSATKQSRADFERKFLEQTCVVENGWEKDPTALWLQGVISRKWKLHQDMLEGKGKVGLQRVFFVASRSVKGGT
jgi:hypothetical protein